MKARNIQIARNTTMNQNPRVTWSTLWRRMTQASIQPIGIAATSLALILLLNPAAAVAQGTIAPSPKFTGFTNAGVPCAGCGLFTYIAGTTTLSSTYADVALTVPNTNPIVLDSAGRATIYLTPGSSYKFVLQDVGGAVIWTQDNVSAMPATSASVDVLASAAENANPNDCVYLSGVAVAHVNGLWYRCSAAAATSSSGATIVGIAQSGLTAGSTGVVRIAGSVTMGGLSNGLYYYVSSTPGALTLGPPNPVSGANVQRTVGVGNSLGQLILTANPAPAASWSVVTTTLTGTQNNFSIDPVSSNVVLRCQNASLMTLTGMTNGFDGQHVIVEALNTEVDLVSQSGSSLAANRLVPFVTSGLTPIAPGGSAEFVYDGTALLWRMVAHDQGAWIAYTPTYGANGAQTFTSVTTTTVRYRVSGRTVQVAFDVSGTVGGTPNTQVTFTLPNSYTAAATTFGIYDRNLEVAALFQSTAASATVSLWYDATTGTNWGAGVKRLLGSVAFEVQ